MELGTPLSRFIIFGILLSLMIPSVICSFLILYYFARSRQLFKRLNNHVILALILINLIQVTTEMPFTLIVLYTGFVAVQSHLFCLFWAVYNYALIVIYPCEHAFDYTKFVCGGACYQYEFALGLYDWLSNVGFPVIFGAVVTAALIIRVFLQKHRVGQQRIWRRNRKMAIQLTSISMMYIIIWIPTVVFYVISLIIPSLSADQLTAAILNYFQYFSYLLCPFMCLVGLPEIRDSVKHVFVRSNNIQPIA